MPICRDQAVDGINRAGFDVVRVPDARIAPLDLIVERAGGLVRVTSLPAIWTSEMQTPAIAKRPAANLSTVRTADLRGTFGLSVLAQALGRIRLGAGGGRESSLSFEAKDCMILGCDLAEVASWIARGDFKEEANFTLIEPDDRAWVVVEVLRSARLDIVVGSGGNVSAEAAAEDLTKTIQGQVKGGRTTHQGTTVEHHGAESLTFGFKSAELLFDGEWKLDLPEKPGRKFLGKEYTDKAASELAPIGPGRRVRLTIGE